MTTILKTSAAGISAICAEEGFVGHVYPDSGKIPTIGYGHVLLPGEAFPNGVTRDQAFDLMARDLVRFERAVNGIGVELTQNQFDALVSFAYNAGPGGVRQAFAAHLQRGDFAAASNEFEDGWDKSKIDGVLQTNPVLTRRRRRERAMFDGKVEPLTSIKALQAALAKLGYNVGPVDGIVGQRTVRAVEAFQSAQGIRVDGIPGRITRTLLANLAAKAAP